MGADRKKSRSVCELKNPEPVIFRERAMTVYRILLLTAFVACQAFGTVQVAASETSDVRIAKQYGIGYLPLMIIEADKLLEKHASARGLSNVQVKWTTFAGANVMNDALLSGDLDLAAVGTPVIPILWAKTHGSAQEIKAVCGLSSVPLYLNTRNPKVKTVGDFSEKSKIALPAVKVSTMAIVLQMAAEKAFGPGNHARLDPLTVSRSHPDGMAAMLSESSEIDSHFSWPPYQYWELKRPGIHTVLSSNDVLGGSATTVVIIATKRFRDANPRIFGAFLAAMEEADDVLTRNRRHAAEVYLQVTKDKDTVENIQKMLEEPGQFSIVPQNVMKYVDFMYRTGMIKQKPASWKELFFPEVHSLPGS